MEHLSEQDKEKSKKNNNKSPIESFLGVAEEHSKTQGASNGVGLSFNMQYKLGTCRYNMGSSRFIFIAVKLWFQLFEIQY